MTVLTLLLLSVLSISVKVPKVYADGPIRIKADGSVDPPGMGIFSNDNITYAFVNGVNDSIIVERNNIIIDGAGHALQGKGIVDPYSTGINVTERVNVTIKNVKVERFNSGVRIIRSSNIIIFNNYVTNNTYDIFASESTNSSIFRNNVTDSGYGIVLNLYSSFNSISSNYVANNSYGIRLDGVSYNSVYANFLTDNSIAVVLPFSSSNRIYNNNFINNTLQTLTDTSSSGNIWDTGYPYGGNFWSTYTGSDENKDAIGDTPHIIDSNNTDNYPLMGIFSIFNAYQGNYVSVVSNSTIDDLNYVPSNKTIRIRVSNSTPAQTFGFCRISIPHALMNGPFNVIIDGARPSYVNYTLYDNGTDRWIYFSYQHSTREIVIIVSEFQSIILLPAFMMATLLATIMYTRRKRLR